MAARGPLAAGALAVSAAALCAAGPAAAHHSFASFDTSRVVRVDGVVVEFQWTNPHAWLEVDVTNPKGEVDRWGVEFNSPNNLTREGWSRHMLEPGQKVTVFLHPLRDGRPAGLYYAVRFADGETKVVHMTPFVAPPGFDVEASPSAYDIAQSEAR